MKTYTFTLPKNENKAKMYKDEIIKKTITAYPWLTIDSSFDYPKSDYGVAYANAGDMLTLGLSKTHNVSWLPKNCATCPLKCFANNNINFDLETEFSKAMKALHTYAYANIFPYEKDYDFEDEFGTPVKIFDNFVQIGYEIIPIAQGSLSYLKPKTKKTIIDITIKIKKSGLF